MGSTLILDGSATDRRWMPMIGEDRRRSAMMKRRVEAGYPHQRLPHGAIAA